MDEMKKTVVLNKVNLQGIFLRIVLPLAISGVVVGILLGMYATRGDTADITRLAAVLKIGLAVGLQGLALSILITLLAGIYNVIIGVTGGIRLTSDDTDNR